jgi:hypothetical protein
MQERSLAMQGWHKSMAAASTAAAAIAFNHVGLTVRCIPAVLMLLLLHVQEVLVRIGLVLAKHRHH